jgi:hypothetical protein
MAKEVARATALKEERDKEARRLLSLEYEAKQR